MAVSAYVIAAIAGCFKRESSVNPGIWESLIVPEDTFYHVYQFDHIGGYGFGQFTNVPSSTGQVSWRCRDYAVWCTNHGYMPDNGNAQLEYIFEVEKVWYNSPYKRGDYNSIDEFLASDSQDLETLTWDWLACWEGVPGDAFLERYEAAIEFLEYITAHQNDPPESYTWTSGNFYLSTQQMIDNVMCMYFYMEGYSPGPTPKPTKKKGLPVWMMLRKF